MEFGTSGALNEGTLASSLRRRYQGQVLTDCIDGIHLDMDRLKKGEVK